MPRYSFQWGRFPGQLGKRVCEVTVAPVQKTAVEIILIMKQHSSMLMLTENWA